MLTKFFNVCASAFGGAMDIGVGAFIGVLLGLQFGFTDQSALLCVLVVGSFLAVLPDMDIVGYSLVGARISFDHHQTVLHRPLVVIPVSVLVCGFVGVWLGEPLFAATLALVCVTYHYLHDTFYGIAWLWPFSNIYVMFTGTRNPSDIDPLQDHHDFLQRFITPTHVSLTELLVCGVSMGYAINLATGSQVGTVLACIGALFVFIVWTAYALKKRV